MGCPHQGVDAPIRRAGKRPSRGLRNTNRLMQPSPDHLRHEYPHWPDRISPAGTVAGSHLGPQQLHRNTNRRCTRVKAAQKYSSLLVWTERSRPCAAWAIASRRSLDEARIGENADTSPLLFGVIQNRRSHRAYCRCSPSGARIKLRATTAAPVCCVHFLERRPHCLKIQVTR